MGNDIDDFWEKLKAQRDEMLVQAHLARAEFRDEWDEVEKKWPIAPVAFRFKADCRGIACDSCFMRCRWASTVTSASK